MSAAAPPNAERSRATPLPPAARRASIVDAVAPLLIEQGWTVTTKQIAQTAGISEGTIFNVFADKEELIDTVVDSALDPEPLERRLRALDPALLFEDRLAPATEAVQLQMMHIWRLLSALFICSLSEARIASTSSGSTPSMWVTNRSRACRASGALAGVRAPGLE